MEKLKIPASRSERVKLAIVVWVVVLLAGYVTYQLYKGVSGLHLPDIDRSVESIKQMDYEH